MKQKKLTILVFVDALGYEIAQNFSFLKKYNFHQFPLKSILGYSSAALPSLLSGLHPDEHQHWSVYYYDPENSIFKNSWLLKVLPQRLLKINRIKRLVSNLIAKSNQISGYFSLTNIPLKYLKYFDYLEKKNYFAPNGLLHGQTIMDECWQKGIPCFVSDWKKSSSHNIEKLFSSIQQKNIAFGFLYLADLDALLHLHGINKNIVENYLNQLETTISDLLTLGFENYEDVAFYLASDHGIVESSGSVDLQTSIHKLDLKFGKDYVAMYDMTMARFWPLNKTADQKIKDILDNTPHGHLITEQEKTDLHINFKNDKFGKYIWLAEEGFIISPNFITTTKMKGIHGFHPKYKSSDSVFICNKNPNLPISSIVDIKNLILQEL